VSIAFGEVSSQGRGPQEELERDFRVEGPGGPLAGAPAQAEGARRLPDGKIHVQKSGVLWVEEEGEHWGVQGEVESAGEEQERA